jgi:hypothetical protein
MLNLFERDGGFYDRREGIKANQRRMTRQGRVTSSA